MSSEKVFAKRRGGGKGGEDQKSFFQNLPFYLFRMESLRRSNEELKGKVGRLEEEKENLQQGRKLMSCSQVKSWVNRLTWLLIGCSLLCS